MNRVAAVARRRAGDGAGCCSLFTLRPQRCGRGCHRTQWAGLRPGARGWLRRADTVTVRVAEHNPHEARPIEADLPNGVRLRIPTADARLACRLVRVVAQARTDGGAR